jgi:hypothetical protein
MSNTERNSACIYLIEEVLYNYDDIIRHINLKKQYLYRNTQWEGTFQFDVYNDNELRNVKQEIEFLVSIKTKNDALLNMKHDEEYIRVHCERILKNEQII